MKILIMGLPGSGKTTLAEELKRILIEDGKSVLWLNADAIRKLHDDWDFSHEGRMRQAIRMVSYADVSDDDYVIADFVCPLPEMREIYKADFTIWVDTIDSGRFEDTNKAFQKPDSFDVRVTEQDCKKWAQIIIDKLRNNYVTSEVSHS
jgi:adenylylsulfate kinase